MTDTTPWEEYCETSLDLSNQEDVGDNELAAMETLYCFFEKYDKALKRLADSQQFSLGCSQVNCIKRSSPESLKTPLKYFYQYALLDLLFHDSSKSLFYENSSWDEQSHQAGQLLFPNGKVYPDDRINFDFIP